MGSSMRGPVQVVLRRVREGNVVLRADPCDGAGGDLHWLCFCQLSSAKIH